MIGVNEQKVLTEMVKYMIKRCDRKTYANDWLQGTNNWVVRESYAMYRIFNEAYKGIDFRACDIQTDLFKTEFITNEDDYKDAHFVRIQPSGKNMMLVYADDDGNEVFINEMYLKGYYKDYLEATVKVKGHKDPVFFYNEYGVLDCVVLPINMR